MTDRGFRSSQLISPYGPGSIIDIGDESLVMMDLKSWPKKLKSIELPRLTAALNIRELKSPPVTSGFGHKNNQNAIMTMRFPRWMFCPKCRHLMSWTNDDASNDDGIPICSSTHCNKIKLVPMRFVVACNEGHLQDVPWDYWAHRNAQGNCSDKKGHLFFKSDSDKGSGLDALKVECKTCGSYQSLGKLTAPAALGSNCSGAQPWEKHDKDSCSSELVVLQRGASNLYYPAISSALDIPVSGAVQQDLLPSLIRESESYGALKRNLDKGKLKQVKILADDIVDELQEDGHKYTVDDIIAAVSNTESDDFGDITIPEQEELQFDEWELFKSNNIIKHLSSTFQARIADRTNKQSLNMHSIIKRVVLLDKLREVRAFCGFERVTPDGNIIYPRGKHKFINWLPAIEVFGEGIFIEFNQETLDQWEKQNHKFVSPRVEIISKKYDEGNVSYLPEPSAKLLALHTFAHLLIRQFSFECGYSSGSLRERIYAYEDQAGVLIYTADGDSEGSLGGLVQQGEADRLYPAIVAALETANWCSNDPVCSEMETQGVMGLNKAACHSCSLVSETSCTMNNLMLDRKLLIGDQAHKGLFSSVLTKLNEEYAL